MSLKYFLKRETVVLMILLNRSGEAFVQVRPAAAEFHSVQLVFPRAYSLIDFCLYP